jgi:cell wall-associated NlpC family hydrolase
MTAAFGASAPRGVGLLAANPVTTVLGLAAGAVGAAVVGTQAAQGDLPDLTSAATVTADLHLTAGASPAATSAKSVVAPVSAEPTSAAATVPELTKAAGMAHQQQKIDSAISRFESKIGSTQYENYCERAVENAFGTQGHYASAIDDWESQDQHKDWQDAPRGAMVFYDTSSDGHVALSLGDGRVVSSSAHHQVGIVPVGYFQHPLGWAYAPY